MSRCYRFLLCWLARLAGLIGLIAGGKSLVKYAIARFKDPYFDSFSYNDLVFSGGVIFLLSLLVLILVEVGQSLSRAGRVNPPGLVTPMAGATARTPVPGSPAGMAPEVAPVVEVESADAKLARLLKHKDE